jgi:hypothetical protein
MLKAKDFRTGALLPPVAAMIVVIAVSNVAVQFPINDWLTWGAFTYPLSFLVSELTNRAHGPKLARRVVALSFPIGIVLSVVLSLHAGLPVWISVRIALASGFAFLCGQLFDITVFNWLRRKSWWRAPLASSSLASALDTMIFFAGAFAFTGLPWETWALGDFGIKLGMALVLLAPFRILMPIIRPTLYQPAPRA